MASLLLSAVFSVIGVWGCPDANWLHWGTLGFFLLAGCFGIWALWLARWSRPKGFTEIANQEFVNQDVLLDGYAYIACRFTNVTFVYNGGECGGIHGDSLLGGILGFRTGDPKLGQVLAVLKEMKFIPENRRVLYTPVLKARSRSQEA